MVTLSDAAPAPYTRTPRMTLSPLARRAHALLALLPKGHPLTDARWEARHRGIAIFVWAHVPLLLAVGLATGHTVAHSFAEVVPVAACGLLALAPGRGRYFRASAATVGLVVCSAMLVHLSGGNVEMHFHFFVIVGVITLYQDWVPFGLALLFVVLHHGVVGVLNPSAVYNHEAAQNKPWLWAGIHGAFVLAASVAQVLAWRLNEEQSLRDELTHLPNRAMLSDRVRGALGRRFRDGRDVTVLFVDLDGFKDVNDTMGHAAGDQLLVEVARRVRSTVRSVDTAARLGGDEFAILLDGYDRAAAVTVAERILESLRQPVRVDGHERTIGASIGVVAVTHETSVDQVLRNADLAMYMAKAGGRGRVEVFEDAMFDDAIDRSDLERDLRTAVAEGQISVSYQPSVDLASGAVHGVEALVRWTHPERGNVPPPVFIPVAESTGLIHELGRYVLRTACRDAVRLRASDPALTVAVNVSARQLANPSFPGEVADALRDTGLDGSALIIEITESMLVHDVDQTVARLREIKAFGVRVAIDDFGTGYSSLSYLRHFPIDILKIDRSFVEQLPGDGAALARSIVRLGQSLKMEVVAEGVEDDAQRTELRRLGCANAQGFLFAKAAPVDDVEALLHDARGTTDWWRPDVAGLLPVQREQAATPVAARP